MSTERKKKKIKYQTKIEKEKKLKSKSNDSRDRIKCLSDYYYLLVADLFYKILFTPDETRLVVVWRRHRHFRLLCSRLDRPPLGIAPLWTLNLQQLHLHFTRFSTASHSHFTLTLLHLHQPYHKTRHLHTTAYTASHRNILLPFTPSKTSNTIT